MRFLAWLIPLTIALTGTGCQTQPRPGADESAHFTHGPMLGRVEAHKMGVWARTARSGTFAVRYGTGADRLDSLSPAVVTRVERDNHRLGSPCGGWIPGPGTTTGWSGWRGRRRSRGPGEPFIPCPAPTTCAILNTIRMDSSTSGSSLPAATTRTPVVRGPSDGACPHSPPCSSSFRGLTAGLGSTSPFSTGTGCTRRSVPTRPRTGCGKWASPPTGRRMWWT